MQYITQPDRETASIILCRIALSVPHNTFISKVPAIIKEIRGQLAIYPVGQASIHPVRNLPLLANPLNGETRRLAKPSLVDAISSPNLN